MATGVLTTGIYSRVFEEIASSSGKLLDELNHCSEYLDSSCVTTESMLSNIQAVYSRCLSYLCDLKGFHITRQFSLRPPVETASVKKAFGHVFSLEIAMPEDELSSSDEEEETLVAQAETKVLKEFLSKVESRLLATLQTSMTLADIDVEARFLELRLVQNKMKPHKHDVMWNLMMRHKYVEKIFYSSTGTFDLVMRKALSQRLGDLETQLFFYSSKELARTIEGKDTFKSALQRYKDRGSIEMLEFSKLSDSCFRLRRLLQDLSYCDHPVVLEDFGVLEKEIEQVSQEVSALSMNGYRYVAFSEEELEAGLARRMSLLTTLGDYLRDFKDELHGLGVLPPPCIVKLKDSIAQHLSNANVWRSDAKAMRTARVISLSTFCFSLSEIFTEEEADCPAVKEHKAFYRSKVNNALLDLILFQMPEMQGDIENKLRNLIYSYLYSTKSNELKAFLEDLRLYSSYVKHIFLSIPEGESRSMLKHLVLESERLAQVLHSFSLLPKESQTKVQESLREVLARPIGLEEKSTLSTALIKAEFSFLVAGLRQSIVQLISSSWPNPNAKKVQQLLQHFQKSLKEGLPDFLAEEEQSFLATARLHGMENLLLAIAGVCMLPSEKKADLIAVILSKGQELFTSPDETATWSTDSYLSILSEDIEQLSNAIVGLGFHCSEEATARAQRIRIYEESRKRIHFFHEVSTLIVPGARMEKIAKGISCLTLLMEWSEAFHKFHSASPEDSALFEAAAKELLVVVAKVKNAKESIAPSLIESFESLFSDARAAAEHLSKKMIQKALQFVEVEPIESETADSVLSGCIVSFDRKYQGVKAIEDAEEKTSELLKLYQRLEWFELKLKVSSISAFVSEENIFRLSALSESVTRDCQLSGITFGRKRSASFFLDD